MASSTNVINKLQDENDHLKKCCETFNFRMNSIEQDKLNQNIEISGIEYKKEENLREIVRNLGEKVGVNVNENNIITVYRKRNRNKQTKGSTHSIILVLDSTKRNDFIKNCRKVKQLNSSILGYKHIEKRPIYINYQLTKTSQFLLAKAKEKRNQNFF